MLLLSSATAIAKDSVYLSSPAKPAAQRVSMANRRREYRLDAARHFAGQD